MFPYLKLWSRSSVHFRGATAGAQNSAECCAGCFRLDEDRLTNKLKAGDKANTVVDAH